MPEEVNDMLILAERAEKAGAEEQREVFKEVYRIAPPRDEARFLDLIAIEAYENAALMLIPEGYRTAMVSEMDHREGWLWRLAAKTGHGRWGKRGHDGVAVTAALALVASCLRARGGEG